MFEKVVREQEFNPTGVGMLVNNCYLIRRIISEAVQRNAPELTGKILDYGCGSRPYERFFTGRAYVGVDIEVSGHPSDRKKADFFFDGIKLPFKNNEFDGIIASEVIEHIFNLNECLAEIYRVLKPGGKFFITCPFVWPLHEEPYDFARYTPYSLTQILHGAGFRIMKIERGGTPIEAIGQLFITQILPPLLYLFFRFPQLCYWMAIPAMGMINIFSRITAKMFKSIPNLYLTNIVLAEKI